MYTKTVNLNASMYKAVFSGSSGKLYVPVKPNATLYTQFDYVKGTPAERGQRGISVNRVRILNTLIDQLVSMKKSVDKKDVTELSDNQKDALIQNYQKEIETSISLSSLPGTYGLAGLMPEPGSVFSISA